MISGSAVETTVLERIATNMPSRRPDMASSTSRCVIAGGSAGRVVGAVVVIGAASVIVFSIHSCTKYTFGYTSSHDECPRSPRAEEAGHLARHPRHRAAALQRARVRRGLDRRDRRGRRRL